MIPGEKTIKIKNLHTESLFILIEFLSFKNFSLDSQIELLNKQNQPSTSKSLDLNPPFIEKADISMYLCTMATLGQQVEL